MPELSAETVCDVAALAPLREEWDALAVAASRPYSQPAWMLAWWEHCRPGGSELRVVVVREGERLVGIAPFHALGSRYRMLGAEFASNVVPLALADREDEVGAAIAGELARDEQSARAIGFDLVGDSPSWPTLLSAAWPGPAEPWQRVDGTVPAPFVEFEEGASYEDWLSGKSSKFRYWVRQGRRKLEAAGAEFRISTAETLEHDVHGLLRLHRMRHWEGGSILIDDGGPERMLIAAGSELIAAGRFKLMCIDIDGRIVSAQLMISAGTEVGGWNGGFDPAYAKLSPALHGVIYGMELAIAGGCCRLDLGPGAQPYKARLASGERQLTSSVLVPRGSGYARTRLGLAWRAVPAAVRRRLPSRVRRELRKGAGRASSSPTSAAG